MTPEAIRDIISGKCLRFEEMFCASRIEEMVAGFYLPSAVLEGRDLPPQRDHGAIARIFREARDTYESISIELDPLEIHDTVAFGTFTNRNTLPTGEVEIHRGIMIWRKIQADWLVARDFFFAEGDPLFVDELQSANDDWLYETRDGSSTADYPDLLREDH